MKLPLFPIGIAVLSSFTLVIDTFASLSIESLDSEVFLDFTDFDGSGFSPNPLEEQLDSDMWAVDGLSEGSLDFGGTATSGDFARGISSGGETKGGIYAFDVGGGNIALGTQPTASDWASGAFTLRLQNNTGLTLTELGISYSIYLYNDQDRESSFNFSHSADNDVYTQVSELDFTSPGTGSKSPVWLETELETTITELSIAAGEYYYFRWSGDDISNSGSRDEFGLGNISMTAVPEPSQFGLICGLIVLFLVGRRVSSS